MTLEYSLDKEDYLQYQLYIASQSPTIKKKRFKGKSLVPVIYIVFGLLLLPKNVIIGTVAFFLFAIVWYFFYPLWDKRVYVKHYQKWLDEHYKERFNRVGTIEITEEYIREFDGDNESKLSTAEVTSIDEIPGAIYIRLKTGVSLIIPARLINDELRGNLKELAGKWNVPYKVNQQWKWK